jgi:hypothetical protein
VQPVEQKGSSKELHLSLPHILQICQSIPHVEIQGWDDIHRVDVRPSRGMLKVSAKNNWEIQIDAKTGDEVEVFGNNNSIFDMALSLKTIPYEIIAGISMRVHRVYMDE